MGGPSAIHGLDEKAKGDYEIATTTKMEPNSLPGRVFWLLAVSTIMIWILAIVLVAVDHRELMEFWQLKDRTGITPPTRIITEKVVMAFIAGSVAQVGACAYAMTKGMFSSKAAPKKGAKPKKPSKQQAAKASSGEDAQSSRLKDG
ncbi:MAG: hypothetical protein KGJ57_16395 [Sphingomonadales bacterium]|nr:hypothetical protein [Sphingomonadales bacterium]MDE2170980.1 hypothetical protein [Sphingomonadales bacterium]